MGIFSKIKSFFVKVFSKNKLLDEGKIETNKKCELNDKTSNKRKNMDRKEILEIVNRRPELLEKLSYDQLVLFNEICEDKIKRLEKIVYMSK